MDKPMTQTTTEPDDVARMVEAKINSLLAPMVAEMKLGKWKPELQEMMWRAIGLVCLKKASEAKQ